MTIYDIAKLANCSASTVSRVINKRGGVSRKKQEEIEALLKQHNYMPDENARSLVMQTNKTIGILVDAAFSEHMTEGIIRIEYELLTQGYFCFVKLIEPSKEGITNGIQTMLRHRVLGTICLGVTFRELRNHVSQVVAQYLPTTPVVLVNQMQSLPNSNIYTVGTDERTGFENSVNLLAERGCHNLALLLDQGRRSAKVIRTGFGLGVQNHPDINSLVLDELPAEMEHGKDICERLLREMPAVDGIIASNTKIGLGVLYSLQDRGIKVPEQIMMITEGSDHFFDICRPTMTCLNTMLMHCAALSAHTMLDILNGRPVAHSITLQLEIQERSSTMR